MEPANSAAGSRPEKRPAMTAVDPDRRDGRDPAAPGSERMLLACDGGPASAAALRWLIDRVGDRALGVELFSLVDPTAPDAAQRRRSVDGMAQLLALVAPDADLTVTEAAADPIEQLARRPSDTLLVIGAHRGDRRGGRFVEAVVDRARCPVIVVPSEWISRQGPVVVGIGAEDAETATLAFAEREAAVRGSEVRLVHVWDMMGPGAVPPSWDFGTESIPERQRRALSRLDDMAQNSHPGLRISSEVSQGKVVLTLAEAARHAALLVIGRSHQPAVVRGLFGSTAQGVLSKLPCPIAVVP